jgi:hypothetical protein
MRVQRSMHVQCDLLFVTVEVGVTRTTANQERGKEREVINGMLCRSGKARAEGNNRESEVASRSVLIFGNTLARACSAGCRTRKSRASSGGRRLVALDPSYAWLRRPRVRRHQRDGIERSHQRIDLCATHACFVLIMALPFGSTRAFTTVNRYFQEGILPM